MFKKRRFAKRPLLPYHKRKQLKILYRQILLPIVLLQLIRTILLPTTVDIVLLIVFVCLYILALLK